jgi:hypothetical protein
VHAHKGTGCGRGTGSAIEHGEHGTSLVCKHEEQGDAILDHTVRGKWAVGAAGPQGILAQARKEKLLKFDLNNTLNDFG